MAPTFPEITGSASDVTGAILSLGDQLSAAAGLTYNLVTFALTARDAAPPTQPRDSAATKGSKQGSSAAQRSALRAVGLPTSDSFLQIEGRTGFFMGQRFIAGTLSEARFAVRAVRSEGLILGAPTLIKQEGFSTKIGNQVSVEFAAQSLKRGAILTVKGFLDPVGTGFAHFFGQLLVDVDKGKVLTAPLSRLNVVQPPPLRDASGLSTPELEQKIKSSMTPSGFKLEFGA